jgi:superfamily I DNA/RNA helicase
MELPDVAKSDNSVLLSTVHVVKGLEFENVLIAGCGDNTFPLSKALNTVVANAVNYSYR